MRGAAMLQDGLCCLGGMVGSSVDLAIAFDAHSDASPISEMRYRLAGYCLPEDQVAQALWQPYAASVSLPVRIEALIGLGYG